MKRLFIAALAALFCTSQINAQVTVKEPDFVGEVILLTSDSTGINLELERPKMKHGSSTFSKIASFAPVPGANLLSKSEMKYSLKGNASESWVEGRDIRFIVRMERQDHDPRPFLRVLKFEQKKKKRESTRMSFSFLGGAEMNNESEKYSIAKYGENSFLITLKGIEPGQYGVITMTEMLGIRTFGVK